MRILIIDPYACALDWAMRCQDAGHQVKWRVQNNLPTRYDVSRVGEGIVDRIEDFHTWFKWPDLIFVAYNSIWMGAVDKWVKEGYPVVGCTSKTALWETDRSAGMNIFKQADVEIPPTKEFTDYDKAIAFVKKNMLRYVSKPSDSPDKSLSYCSKSPADMVYMLERWKKFNKLKGSFILQEFISGAEMAVGGWFGPGGFNRGWCENFEFKKLMNDDLGVATGEQGTVLRYVKSSSLADKVLKPIEDQLASEGYVGYIDVNCIIDDDGTPQPLEFTMRPGWPTFNFQGALHKGDPAEWLLNLAEGTDAKNVMMDTVCTGVCLSIPDFPYSLMPSEEMDGIPIYGIEKVDRKHIHYAEMRMGEAPQEVDGKIVSKPCLVTAGDYVLESTGVGKTVTEAKKAAYGVLKKISLPNSPMYRTDIGNRLKKQLPILQSLGYATGMEF